MQNPKVASRYAKSLLDLAMERGQEDQVHDDMLYFRKLVDSSRDFTTMLRSPVIPSDKKIKVFEGLTKGRTGELAFAFLRLLIAKNREINLPEIITSYIKQYKIKKGIHVVQLTTAAPVSDKVTDAIVNHIKATSTMQKIEMETKVDPSLIGGFLLQAGDKLVDASISSDLKEVARKFENNDFIYKVR